MQAAHISVQALTHTYALGSRSLTALDGVDLDVGPGSFVSIIGPSGCGKTTLLRAIGGLLEPTAGSIHIDSGTPEDAQRRKAIGFVFQDPSLLPWRTVYQNIALPLQMNGGEALEERDGPDRLLLATGLAEFRDYHPHQLSAGMRQRVAFARALVMDPAVLLMDEPLGALDEITRSEMRYELLRLWEDSPKTVVLVTHSIAEAITMSDLVVVMSARPGKITQEVRIDLPRPREESLEQSGRFLEYTNQIKELLSKGAVHGSPALHASSRN